MNDAPELDLDAAFAQLEATLAHADEATIPDPPASPGPVLAAAVEGGREERREAPRIRAQELGGDVRLSIRGGADARAIDVSETGVLAETTSRLRPGGLVELLLQINGVRLELKATVVRSMVHSLGPTIFRTAFKFNDRTKLPERK